ncbi:transcriptional regulator [Clostridium tetanomorphum DSM 665]|nr:transcriptional regulator [Clostridium tetanomorphum DSM 665]
MPYTGGPMTESMYYVLLAFMHPNQGYQLMNSIKEVSNVWDLERCMERFPVCKKIV